MKRNMLKMLTLVGVLGLMFSACNKQNTFTVKGMVSDAEGETLYLENVGVEVITLMDSVKLSSNGKFSFTKSRPAYPDFYRFRLEGQLINFPIDSLETLSFVADAGNFATSYSVEGTEKAKEVKHITLLQLDANQSIVKARRSLDTKEIADTTYQSIVKKAADKYRQEGLAQIYKDPLSMASYYALFQKVNGLLFFDPYNKEDLRAYAAVATSFDHYYPKSARSIQLKNLTLRSMKLLRGERPITLDNVKTTEVSYVDIELPDEYNKLIKLSDVAKNKLTLINFTAYQMDWSPGLNMRLGELYTKYHAKGMNIYQVSLDADENFWKNAASNLPWSCVRDAKTVYSQIAVIYNVKQLPALFILDKNGTLVKRVSKLEELESDVKKYL